MRRNGFAPILILVALGIFLVMAYFLVRIQNTSKDAKSQSPVSNNDRRLSSEIPKNVGSTNYFQANILNKENAILFAPVESSDIWVTDKQGKNAKKLIWSSLNPKFGNITWSPDGNNIAFIAIFENNSPLSGFYIYNGLSGEIQFVEKSDNHSPSGTWSRDSRYFGYLSEADTGKGPLKVYDAKLQKTSSFLVNSEESKNSPVYWDNSNRLYLETFIPVEYCETATVDCPVLEETKARSTHSITRVNVDSGKVEKIVTQKLTDGGIQEYLLINKNNTIIYSTGDDKLHIFDLNTSTEKTVMKTFDGSLLEGYIEISPSQDFFTILSSGPGGLLVELVSLSDFSSKKLIDYNTNSDLITAYGWYDNTSILAYSHNAENMGIYTFNINNSQRVKLFDKEAIPRVRPQ